MSSVHGLFTFRQAGGRLTAMLHATPTIVVAVVLVGTLMCLPDPASAQFSPRTQAQCELSAIGSTRSPFAIQTIRSACNWLAVNEGSLLNESLRPYYLCLVQNLSGAQSDVAATSIVSACRAANPR
jgi:hypothetical protein